jgi:DNA-binding NtrC family response regulator
MSSRRATVLVVEDEAPQRDLIAGILNRSGYEVHSAPDVDAALAAIAETAPDVVLCDWRLPGRTGGDLLDALREQGTASAVIVMTAYGSIAHAVEAVRRGATDYLAKPFEREALLLAVQRVLRTRELERENLRLRAEAEVRDGYGEVIGRAPAMQALYRTLEKVADTEATVLVTGESGTGKELVARMLHRRSRRGSGPFVAVNCAAIPESLMESELFGHERGAFTGAHRRREGKFEEASGGTLFLDEVASMPLALQAKVLRALQERRVTRLGGTGEVACDARVVAATNRDLADMVAEGSFREDLYYRLNVFPVRLPPLRERREDIPALADVLVRRAAERHATVAQQLPQTVLRRLMEHTWPGNVRELANALERLVLLAEDGRVSVDDLPPEIGAATSPGRGTFHLPPSGIAWDEMEEDLLRQALELADGNRAGAARLLGLSYKTFLYRLAKFGLDEQSTR